MEILSIIVLGFAIFAIMFTFLAIFMNRWKRVKPKSKCDAKKFLIVKYPMIFLYFLMLGFALIVVNQEDEQVEAKGIDDIINQIRSILAVGEIKLYALKPDVNVGDRVLEYAMGDFYEEYFWVNGKCGKIVEEMVFSTWRPEHVEKETRWIGNCRGEPNVTMTVLHDLLETLGSQHRILRLSVGDIGENFRQVLKKCYVEMNRQSEHNTGIKIRKQYRDALEDMIRHYENDLDKTEFKREEWYEKTKEFSPKFNTQLIVKWLVSATTMSIYFLLPISIFAASHHIFLGSKGFTKAISISLYLNGLLTISICGIAILLSTGLIGRFNCLPEVKKLGLWRLTSPFPFRDKYLSICSRPNTTFFSELKSVKMPEPDVFMNDYDFDIIKTILQNTTSSFITVPPISQEYNETFEKVQKINGLLKKYIAQGCLNENHMADLKWTDGKLKNHTEYNECIPMFNTNNNKIFDDSEFVGYREKAKKHIIVHEKDFFLMLDQDIDFSCDKIIDLFSNIGGAVCEQFNVKLDIYWIYIIVTIIVCMLNSLFIIFLYRSYESAVDDETYQTIKESTNQSNMNSKNK